MSKLKELRKKQRKSGVAKRPDIAKNLVAEFNTELEGLCDEEGISVSEGLNIISPDPEPNRPVDATHDILEYYDLPLANPKSRKVLTVLDCFPAYENPWGNARNIASFAYLDDFVHSQLIGSIPKLASPQAVVDSSLNRGDLERSLNRETILPLEVKRDVRNRVVVADVVAGRLPMVGNKALIPVLNTQPDVAQQGTAGGRVDRYNLEFDQKDLETSEDGFEMAIRDNVRENSGATMEGFMEAIRQKIEFTDNRITNGLIQLILNGANAFSMSATPTIREIIKLHLTPDDNYMLTTFAGTLEAVVEYAAVDPSYASDTARPGAPRLRNRNLIDAILGQEQIFKRKAANVPALGSDNDKKMGTWDKGRTCNFYTRRGGTNRQNMAYREERDRQMVYRYLFEYAGRLREEADQCRYFVTMA